MSTLRAPIYGGEDIIVGGMYAIPSNWIPKKAMKVAIAVGGSPCVNPEIVGTAGKLNWKCTTTKGMGKGQQITMVINGAPSRNTSKMQYDYVTPDITSIQPSSGPFYGNWTISIRGKYLGRPALSKHTDVTIGNALCKDVKIVSDTEIQCTAPQLPPKDKYPVMITMHKQYSGTPFSGLDFTTPKVDSAEPAVGATYGGTKVVFSGTGMGTASLIQSGALQVYVAGSPCTTLKLIQDNGAKSSVECEVPSADGEKFFEHVPSASGTTLIGSPRTALTPTRTTTCGGGWRRPHTSTPSMAGAARRCAARWPTNSAPSVKARVGTR
jgi:hypothetical protein